MKFYVEIEESDTYHESTYERFHYDHPFETVDEAIAYAEPISDKQDHGAITVFQSIADVLRPVLYRGSYSKEWEDYAKVNWNGIVGGEQ